MAPIPGLKAHRTSPSMGTAECRELLPQVLEEFLDPGEKAFAFGVRVAVLAFLFEFAEQLLLPLGQVAWGLDNRLDKHVAARGRAQHRHPLRPEPELMPRLSTGWHRDARSAAVDGWHLDRATEGCRGDRQRHPTMDIGAVALEDPMRCHADEDEEITRR